MTSGFNTLARRQLSESLATYTVRPDMQAPGDGWIAAIRKALEMTVRQYAERMGVSASNVVRMEQRERDGTISLAVLRRAADALDADLVYAVIPRRTGTVSSADGLLDTLIEKRAREVAALELRRLGQTMLLEGQSVRAADYEAQLNARAAELLKEPRRLWDPDPK